MTTGRFLIVAVVTIAVGVALLAWGGSVDEPWLEVAGAACIGLTFLARAVFLRARARRPARRGPERNPDDDDRRLERKRRSGSRPPTTSTASPWSDPLVGT
jgi:hypothetical protein